MVKSSTAMWNGPGRTGSGSVTCESKLLQQIPFNFDSRFWYNLDGTNPEELLAAAHASCFAMKLSFILDEAGHEEKSIRVTSKIGFVDGSISGSDLEVWAYVPRLTEESFKEMVGEAQRFCPVCRALNVPITCTPTLISR
jgi:osmotically inducible protein OsmC